MRPQPVLQTPVAASVDIESPPPRRVLTDRQIQANRDRARRSTGPSTPEGKARSRFNALRHGLRANCAILFEEDAGELRRLGDQLAAALRPADVTQFVLLEHVVAITWKLRRCRRALEEAAFRDHGRTLSRWQSREVWRRYGPKPTAGFMTPVAEAFGRAPATPPAGAPAGPGTTNAEPAAPRPLPPEDPEELMRELEASPNFPYTPSGPEALAIQFERSDSRDDPATLLRLETYELKLRASLLSAVRQYRLLQKDADARSHRRRSDEIDIDDDIDDLLAPRVETDMTPAPTATDSEPVAPPATPPSVEVDTAPALPSEAETVTSTTENEMEQKGTRAQAQRTPQTSQMSPFTRRTWGQPPAPPADAVRDQEVRGGTTSGTNEPGALGADVAAPPLFRPGY